MSIINPRLNALALVHSCRALLRPTLADRDRIQAALRVRLGADVLRAESIESSPAGIETASEDSEIAIVRVS
jgi:hypothetical protein